MLGSVPQRPWTEHTTLPFCHVAEDLGFSYSVLRVGWSGGGGGYHSPCRRSQGLVRGMEVGCGQSEVGEVRVGVLTLPEISMPISSNTWLTIASCSSSSPDSFSMSSSVSLTVTQSSQYRPQTVHSTYKRYTGVQGPETDTHRIQNRVRARLVHHVVVYTTDKHSSQHTEDQVQSCTRSLHR